MIQEVIVEVQHIYSDDRTIHFVMGRSKAFIKPFRESKTGRYKPAVEVYDKDGKLVMHLVVIRGLNGPGDSLDPIKALLIEFDSKYNDSTLSLP